jgi:hypothetical protein
MVIELMEAIKADDKHEYDAARATFLENLGLTVIPYSCSRNVKNMGWGYGSAFKPPTSLRHLRREFKLHTLEGPPPKEGGFRN